jgi:hypothetical protein
LDGSPPFSGFDAKAGMEPNRLPDGAAGAGVLLPANCRCSLASSNLLAAAFCRSDLSVSCGDLFFFFGAVVARGMSQR